MKLFRHYKNKPYKYAGLAKHSETLEDMVIYETRYENEKGKIWVRPKQMFFESVEVNGRPVPRFQEIPLELTEKTEVTAADIEQIAPVIEKAFGEWDPKWFYGTFNNHRKFHLVLARVEGQAVAFKLGYEDDPRTFYSWLGGVIPDYRGLGIAAALMSTQHDWCRKHGYHKVQTKTLNRFRAMLILNIRHGFEIIGTHLSDEGGFKILLSKNLREDESERPRG